MKLSHTVLLALSLVSSFSWAQAPVADTPAPALPSALTDAERANLLEHAQDLRAEGSSLSQEATEIDLVAMKKDLATQEAQLLSVAPLLSEEALKKRTEAVDQLRVAVDAAESLQPRADMMKGLAAASEHAAKTGDLTLKSWDDLSELARVGETFKYSALEFIKPGPLAAFAAGNAAWYVLKKQKTINQSFYDGLQGKIPTPIVQTGQYLPFVAAGATGVVYFIALKQGNSWLRDLSEELTVGLTANIAATEGLKALLHDCRPGPVCVAQNGAPSGHASTSFVLATIIDHHFGHKWGFIAYAAASGIILTRLANTDPKNVHALGQTIDGALQGLSIGWATSNGLARAKAAYPGEKRSLVSKLAYGNFKGGSYACSPQVGLSIGGGCVIEFGRH